MATKYQPLVDHVAAQTAGAVTLTFVEIEAIIGRPLSVSAMTMASIWHNTTQPHVRQWQAIGWRAHYDRRNWCVHFTRDAEEE